MFYGRGAHTCPRYSHVSRQNFWLHIVTHDLSKLAQDLTHCEEPGESSTRLTLLVRLKQCLVFRALLLGPMAPTSPGVLRRLHVVVRISVFVSGLAVYLFDKTILVLAAHPLLQVAVQLATCDATSSAEHWGRNSHLLYRARLLDIFLFGMTSPSSFNIIRC